jgi:lysophospholipase L1-like esterase
VAPVREPSILKLQYWKNIVKKVIFPGKPTVEARLRDLAAFNDWIRKYALEQNLPILDLEKALRISETDRRLRDDFDGGDGLHLNQNAYSLLDQTMLITLERINWFQKGK